MMTWEEAIAILQEKYDYCKSFYDLAARPKEDYAETAQYLQALQVALSALRPVSRERVEKVWRSCKVCNGEMTLYQHTNTTKLYMDTFGKAATLVTECNACPPHADCCMKGISANSAFIINYCPECGRPLTDEAVQMVMERLEELHET